MSGAAAVAGGDGRPVGGGKPRSYHGRPVLKTPVWTWEVPCYLFAGGLAGASAALAYGAGAAGNERLARRAWGVALGAVAASPPLLISDLGRPERFLNMLRVFKVTSPMSVGAWVLAGSSSATALAAGHHVLGVVPRSVGRPASAVAAGLGPPLATYTGALLANTAIPAMHEARMELPFLFAGSAAASAGAAAAIATEPRDAGPARRLAVGGALVELAAERLMERRLGDLAEPYRTGDAAGLARASRTLTAAGAGLLAASRRNRAAAIAGGALTAAGSLAQRWAVYRAGFASARDPKYTVGPQRERVEARRSG